MKTDKTGGPAAGDNLEARLARQFAVDLDRAEQDYPTFGPGGRAALARPNQPRGRWPRLAALLAIVAGIAILVPLSSGYLTAPAVPAGPGSGVVLGSDGIPALIDGERVYRIDDDWRSQSGSFLLGAYAVDAPIPCAPPLPSTEPQSSAEADLIPQCGVVELTPHETGNTEYFFRLAPRGLVLLSAWLDGPAIVMRVHTHDSEAARCAADNKADCEGAVVIEAVVWPALPAQIAGERVYRAADQASFPTSGSFLLGGEVTMPDVLPPCPMPIDHTTAENDLIPYCYWEAIDGIRVAPKVDALANLRGRIVVARVHINDPEAAACPAAVLDQCRVAVVVEEVDWTGGPSPSSSPGPSPVATSPVNPASASQGEAESQPANSGLPTPLLPPPSALPAPSASPMHSGT